MFLQFNQSDDIFPGYVAFMVDRKIGIRGVVWGDTGKGNLDAL
jgi:hypothetical protein